MKRYSHEFVDRIESLYEEGKRPAEICRLLKVSKSKVDYILYARPLQLAGKKGPNYIKDPPALPTKCPCGKPLRIEEICTGADPDYYLPLESGLFDLLCLDGHRLYIDCRGLPQFERRREDRRKGHRIIAHKEASDVQEAKKTGDNVSVSLRGKETGEVGGTLDSTAQTRRREMQSTHRRSWKREATK